MIEVMVRVDQSAKRLVRSERPRLLNHWKCSQVTLRRFDKNKMIIHLDQHAVM
jgi:hypothetical protein